MSFQRIRFRDQDESNTYTLPINPHIVNFIDSPDNSIRNVIDGPPAVQSSNFDGRVRRLEWPAYPLTITNFVSMKTELKTYIGELKQIHFGAIDHANWGWKNIRVLSVSTDTPRGGQLENTLVLQFFFTEAI